jgi:hypothetical protein
MRNRKGQSTLEYAIIICVVVAGLFAMQSYVKRGYQGKLKSSADDMGEQFDPGSRTSNYTLTRDVNAVQTVANQTSTTVQNQTQNKNGGTEFQGAWNNTQNVYGQ